MRFKKNKVWMATDHKQKPVLKDGKVRIKYQLDQDYEYWVHQKNVTPIQEASSDESVKEEKKWDREKQTGPTHQNVTESSIRTACKDAICIFTDGASSGNPGPAGIGVVLFYGNHKKEISKYIGIATNNLAELEAIRTGLLAVKNRNLPVRLFTDSRYAYGVLTQGWKARENQKIIQSIKQTLSTFRDLKFFKVKGHAGIEGNERADDLATSAIEKAKIL